jgi:putative aminopeptidase FrvX
MRYCTAKMLRKLGKAAQALRTLSTTKRPWTEPMTETKFSEMRDILAAPSPVGLEAAMTEGVLAPLWQKHVDKHAWAIHRFKGNASMVLDTHPDASDDMLSVMFVGHSDKIRMHVRDIAPDGKVYVETDSFLPLTLLGHHVTIFSRDDERKYRTLRGGTVEALGAIHFAEASHRNGSRGVKPEDIYIELQLHGEQRKKQLDAMGVRVGDAVLLDRKIERGFAPNTFSGAYLDNGLGCFATSEVAELVSRNPLNNVRCMFAIASHEEIGRYGSRVVAGSMKPDIIIAVDVNHDYKAAPNMGSKRFPKLSMGDGFTITQGSITSSIINDLLQDVAKENGIPCQLDVCGRDTGTDGMAGFLASIDAAAASVGFPIRNMHTISEAGHTGDVLSAIHVMYELVVALEKKNLSAKQLLTDSHPRLDQAKERAWDEEDIARLTELVKPHEEIAKLKDDISTLKDDIKKM